MSGAIAKLWAEIGVDTTKLKKGLSESKTELTKMQKGFVGITDAAKTFGTAGLALVGIFSAVGKAAGDMLGDFTDYAGQVREISRLTGASAENASRLIQVADDSKIGFEQLTGALQAAARKGIDPSVESLAKLSDQYLALQPGLERSKFLMDNFGRSGTDVAEMMEQGGTKLRAMNAAIDDNLVLTGKAVLEARNYERAVDDLGDAWTGLKRGLVMDSGALGFLTDYANALQDFGEAYEKTDWLTRRGMNLFSVPVLGAMAAHEKKQRELAQAVELANQSYRSAGGLFDSYAAKAEKAGDATEDLIDPTDQLTASMKGFNKELLFSIASEGLSADAAMALAKGMGMIDEKSSYAYDRIADLNQKYADGLITLADYTLAVKGLGEALGALPEHKSITIEYNEIMHGYSGRSGDQSDGAAMPTTKHAGGGGFVIPAGYPNDSFYLGAGHYGQSGETVTVTPAGQPAAVNQTTINNNFYSEAAVALGMALVGERRRNRLNASMGG